MNHRPPPGIFSNHEQNKTARLKRNPGELYPTPVTENQTLTAVFITDSKGVIISSGKAAEQITGYKAVAFIHKPLSLFYSPDALRLREPAHNFDQALKDGHFEKRSCFLKKDGSLFWADTSFTALFDDKNNFSGFVVCLKTITEQKTSLPIVNPEDPLHIFLEHCPVALAIFDSNMKYVAASRQHIIDFNLGNLNLSGKKQSELFTAANEKWNLFFRDCLAGNNAEMDNDRFTLRDGKRKYFSWKISPWYKTAFEIGGIILFTETITGMQKTVETPGLLNNRLAKEVKELTARLETSNKELEALSYSISHDLRAPLRAIAGFSTMLKEDYSLQMDAEFNRLLDTIVSNSKLMSHLIDDLLSFSRLSRNAIVLQLVLMKPLVESCVVELLSLKKENNIEVHIDDLPVCKADEAMMKQVWIHLLGNAIKYSSNTNRAVIYVGSIADPLMHIYYVKDNGVGFDMQYSHKLFGIFQRLHSQKEFDGAGVGLALAKRIILKHTGSIWPNRCRVQKPLSILESQKIYRMNKNQVEVLLVEDNISDAELTIRALKKVNLANNLLHLKDGAQALDFLFGKEEETESKIKSYPKVILLDIKMPKVDGIEVLRQIKLNEATKKIVVVMMTSSREEKDLIKTYNYGVNSYVVKPVAFEDFVKTISELGLYWDEL